MPYYKEWSNSNYYNFADEFNRIEKYNEYIYTWVKNYYNITIDNLTHKTNWTINDIPDLNDYNRIKSNINKLIIALENGYNQLNITQSKNQNFHSGKANELEQALWANLDYLTSSQFEYKICGLTSCGSNDLYLNIK